MLATTLACLVLLFQVHDSHAQNVALFGQSFPRSTTSITLDSSGLTGTISSEIGLLTALTSLSLNSNSLTGSIPSQISLLTALTSLRLSSNQLSGSLPSGLGQLVQLTFFSADTNQLAGTMPSQLGRLTALQTLKLNDNHLSGTLPLQFYGLSHARLVSLNRNSFVGSISSQVSGMQGLFAIDISETSITGNLPNELFTLPILGAITAADSFVSLDFANSFRCGLLFDCARTLIPSTQCSQCSLTIASQTSTPSITGSITPSNSATRTITPSTSVTISFSSTTSTTPTQSASKTPSSSVSPSASSSITGSTTVTPTTSPTPSLTSTSSATLSATSSSTRSSSASLTRSSSASSTRSSSASSTRSASASLTRSSSASSTRSSSASPTRSSSSSLTPPSTSSSTISSTQSFSQSVSAAFTSSPSNAVSDPTTLLTPVISATPSETSSPSLSAQTKISDTSSNLQTVLVVATVTGGTGLVAAISFVGYHGVRRKRAKHGARDGFTVATLGVGFIALGKTFPIIGQLISLVKDMNTLYEDMQDTGYLSHHFLQWSQSLCQVLIRIEAQLEKTKISSEHVTDVLAVVVDNVTELMEMSKSYATRGKLSKFVGTITFKRTLDRIRDATDIALGALQVGLDSHIIEQNYQLLQVVETLQAKHTALELHGFMRTESLNATSIDPALVKFLDEQAFASGGQASIYRAKYQGNIVAVKVFDCSTMPKKKRTALTTRIYDEIMLLCRLRDPNLINFYGAITKNPDEIVLVMDLAECGNLRDYLQINGNLPTADRIRLLLDLAYGLRYLHEQGVEHRDLKSLNCLLKRDQNNLVRAKVADFGASHFGDRDESSESFVSPRTDKRRSRCSARIVSCGWTPPEVLDGGKHSKASDVYAFGILIWEVMTGLLPYPDSMTDVAVGIAALQGKRPQDYSDAKVLPEALANLMRECWSQNTEQRPTMAKAVIELEAISRFFFQTPRVVGSGTSEVEFFMSANHTGVQPNPSFVHIDMHADLNSSLEMDQVSRVPEEEYQPDSSFEEPEEPTEVLNDTSCTVQIPVEPHPEVQDPNGSPNRVFDRSSSELSMFALSRQQSIDWKRKQSARIRSARVVIDEQAEPNKE